MAKFEGEIEQNATIRVLDNQMAIETGHLQEVLDAFNERYAAYNVNAVDANMDQYVDLEQNGPDGYGPDVLYQANDMLMRYAEGGHILPLPTEDLDIAQIPQTVMDVYQLETYGLNCITACPSLSSPPFLHIGKISCLKIGRRNGTTMRTAFPIW